MDVPVEGIHRGYPRGYEQDGEWFRHYVEIRGANGGPPALIELTSRGTAISGLDKDDPMHERAIVLTHDLRVWRDGSPHIRYRFVRFADADPATGEKVSPPKTSS